MSSRRKASKTQGRTLPIRKTLPLVEFFYFDKGGVSPFERPRLEISYSDTASLRNHLVFSRIFLCMRYCFALFLLFVLRFFALVSSSLFIINTSTLK